MMRIMHYQHKQDYAKYRETIVSLSWEKSEPEINCSSFDSNDFDLSYTIITSSLAFAATNSDQ